MAENSYSFLSVTKPSWPHKSRKHHTIRTPKLTVYGSHWCESGLSAAFVDATQWRVCTYWVITDITTGLWGAPTETPRIHFTLWITFGWLQSETFYSCEFSNASRGLRSRGVARLVLMVIESIMVGRRAVVKQVQFAAATEQGLTSRVQVKQAAGPRDCCPPALVDLALLNFLT